MIHRGAIIDLTGQRFGRLVIVGQASREKYQKPRWQGLCDCGNYHVASSGDIRSGAVRSCGCLNNEARSERKSAKLEGEKFGRLTVVKRVGSTKDGVLWECVCTCGVVKIITTHMLRSGHVNSCGCLSRELNSGRFRAPRYVRDECKLEDHMVWRQYIFERDNYTCVDCGKRGRHLQAHHIIMRSECDELKFDYNNGVTLCVPCHVKIRRHEADHAERFFRYVFRDEIITRGF